jgi:mannose-1-phosphate guanylyltransferase
MIPPERTIVITREELVGPTREQLPEIPAKNIVGEPVGRDTAPCVALGALLMQKIDPEAVMLLLPADHLIDPPQELQRALSVGVQSAREGGLVTYGIVPRYPATGYGYIKAGQTIKAGDASTPAVYEAAAFKEKPDQDTAKAYLQEGGYFWNSGMFTWTCAEVLGQLREHCGPLVSALEPVAEAWGGEGFEAKLGAVYPDLDKRSIDYALMEHAQTVKLVEGRFGWDDLGSWESLFSHLPMAEGQLAKQGDALAIGCENSLLYQAGGPTITAVGLEGMAVVSTPDALLVCPLDQSQRVKELVKQLEQQGRDDLL